MITYVNVPYIFDLNLWGATLAIWRDDVGLDFMAECLEVNAQTIRQWIKPNSAYKEFPHPSMSVFIHVCNELGLRPSDFFTTAE
jgi:hypothetical protein